MTGAIALLWSVYPDAGPGEIVSAALGPPRRRSVVPPLLDARAAHDLLTSTRSGRVAG